MIRVTSPLGGGIGISVLRIWPISGSVFLVFALKKLSVPFSVLVSCFSNLVFGFRFLSTIMAGFLDFCVQCSLQFYWICQGSSRYTLLSHKNCNSKGPLV